MEFLLCVMDNVLGPIFNHDLAMVRTPTLADHPNQRARPEAALNSRSRAVERANRLGSSRNAGDAIIDPRGPKLKEGVHNWIYFYILIGLINLPGAPLYLAIAYRALVFGSTYYIMCTHFIGPMLNKLALDMSYANPIFILFALLSIAATVLNTVSVLHMTTFNLCPLFKVLTTARLCYANRHIQEAVGARTLKYSLAFLAYNSLLCRILTHNNLEHFLHQFNLLDVLLEFYAILVSTYNLVGLSHLDFYVRSCFAFWLLALRSNLEARKARFRCLQLSQRLQCLAHQEAAADSCALPSRKSLLSQFQETYLFISLDQIQKSLNTMDDHLEVTRSIQMFSLFLVSLLAFLGCGTLFLIAYNKLAKDNNYYHGLAIILLAFNLAIIIMITYLGDSFSFYALSKLVQTVEDEYFLQEEGEHDEEEQRCRMESRQGVARDEPRAEVIGDAPRERPRPGQQAIAAGDQAAPGQDEQRDCCARDGQFLTIKRSDVLFCRELLVQFEDHLATPWAKLTLKGHLHIMNTFVTLIAAQIIFDSL